MAFSLSLLSVVMAPPKPPCTVASAAGGCASSLTTSGNIEGACGFGRVAASLLHYGVTCDSRRVSVSSSCRFATRFAIYRRQCYKFLVEDAFEDHRRRRNSVSSSGGTQPGSYSAGGTTAAATGQHFMYLLMLWCAEHNVFIHPALQLVRAPSTFRDFRFYIRPGWGHVPTHAPLVAVPQAMLIGFKKTGEETPQIEPRRNPEEETPSNEDICSFFFDSLNLLVSDLLVALNNERSDPRYLLAASLNRTQTVRNAPYLEESTVFDPSQSCIADVLLQMLHNYIQAGPFTGRVTREELCWAISIGLSHSTPLKIGRDVSSIGIIPLVHLFAHGGKATNSVVVSYRDERSAHAMLQYFEREHGITFSPSAAASEQAEVGFRGVFVVNLRPLAEGDEVCIQAMAPVCNRDDEHAQHMWRLSCGALPSDSLPTAEVATLQDRAVDFIVTRSQLWDDVVRQQKQLLQQRLAVRGDDDDDANEVFDDEDDDEFDEDADV